eukprot:1157510-Pelagomonas_calceolata.AAC.5
MERNGNGFMHEEEAAIRHHCFWLTAPGPWAGSITHSASRSSSVMSGDCSGSPTSRIPASPGSCGAAASSCDPGGGN